MTGCCNKTTDWAHSPLKTVLGKIGNRYQSYCTTYKTHTMTTHHRGTGCTSEDKDLISNVKDARGIDIGPDNDNDSTSSLDTTIYFRGSEADGHLGNLLPSNQAKLSALTKEIHNLHQWMEAREGQSTEGMHHIEQGLQILSLALKAQQTSTSAPT